jgi:hypothetical protein
LRVRIDVFYIFTTAYLWLMAFICVCVCAYMSVHICLCTCLLICLCICLLICLCMCLCMCLSLHVYTPPQVLFMDPEVRRQVLASPVPPPSSAEERAESLVGQLQAMFGALEHSTRRAYNPRGELSPPLPSSVLFCSVSALSCHWMLVVECSQ